MNTGDTAPLDIRVEGPDGPVSLRDTLGSWTVLYFYPADDTPTCTKEACSFRDSAELKNLGAQIIGVSADDMTSHKKFADKYSLPFPLWSDTDHKLMEAMDVWQEKTLFGRKYMGIKRTTFLLDPQGRIAHIWENVRAKGHAEAVAAKLRELDSNQQPIG